MATKSKKISYQRRLTNESLYAIQVYATLTAETLWAWNRLHSMFLELFAALIGEGPRNRKRAHAIWHMFQSDKNQREMLLSVAEATLPSKSHNFQRIKWMMNSVNKIAPYRNVVVHVPLFFGPQGEGKPHAIYLDEEGARDTAKRRLELAGSGPRFWNTLAGDLFVMGQFTAAVISQLNDAPLPDGASLHRPRLRSLRRIREIDQKMSPPQEKSKPKRQRRVSPK